MFDMLDTDVQVQEQDLDEIEIIMAEQHEQLMRNMCLNEETRDCI